MSRRIFCFAMLFLLGVNSLPAQWVQTNGPYGGTVHSLSVSGSNLFAGTYGGVFLSTDNGASWTQANAGLTNTSVYALAVNGSNLFAGTYGGVFLSTDNGASWTQVNTGLTNTWVTSLAVSGSNLFAGTDGGGVFLSTDNGASWTQVNTGLTNTYVLSLSVSGSNLFAGTWGGVWRRPLSEMITGVEDHNEQTPVHFSLAQNYPNPFNPSTTIAFTLPLRSFVSLKVFDRSGREVAQLASEEMIAGNYSRQWDATGFPSGVYFCRLQAGNATVETKKLTLLK